MNKKLDDYLSIRLGVVLLIFLISSQLSADFNEEQIVRRVHAHMSLKDYILAEEEAKNGLMLYPEAKGIFEAHLRALAKLGDEKQMLSTWEVYTQKFPEHSMNRELIEDMAWGILQKASISSSIIMRQMALLAAFFSQEARGVTILCRGMSDSSYSVRSVAAKLSGHYRDDKLIQEVKRLYRSEKVWAVRQEVIASIGNMKLIDMRAELESLIASEESCAEEKALAMSSLLELIDTINRPEVIRLSSSPRAGLRQLACKAIAYFQSERDLDQLLILAKDNHADVRFEAFQAIGQIRPAGQDTVLIELGRGGIKDANYQTALSAAWTLTFYAPREGLKAILDFLIDERREVRHQAAAALNSTGRYGIAEILNQFRSHFDQYVRLNLAFGLIGQRYHVEESSAYISQMLTTQKDKWCKWEKGIFHGVVNYSRKKIEDPMTTPEIDNQLIRLEILNLLAILKVPKTQEMIRQYLMERSWEISTVASALLLTEGDEDAITLVQELLHDSQPRIRLQAALILSLWSREESPIQTLEEGYVQSNWDLRARIVEGIGRIGSMRSVPFLIKVLHEPSQTLRLIASMALIQCLNH